jgi:predicted ATPase
MAFDMITSVQIERFKCFESLHLDLGRLTLLTGYNGAGKSSSLQPLLLMAQALRTPPLGPTLPLNGSLVRLGSAGDVVSLNAGGAIRLGVATERDVSAFWVFDNDRQLGRHELKLVHAHFSFEEGDHPRWSSRDRNELLETVRDVIFLGAVREPFGEAQPYPDDSTLAVGDVGVDGRYAPYWLVRQADEEVPENRRHPDDRRVTVRGQLDAWLTELFPEANVSAEEIEGLALAKTMFRIGRSSDWRRPSNVGYGLSYALPILVALICAKPGQLFVVDSPEAHLHPRAQSAMGRLLAFFAAAGVQIVIESHSDHLLSGVRLAVRQAVLQPEDVMVHFFARSSADGRSRIAIAADGSIDQWPEGFFDQAITDLIGLS